MSLIDDIEAVISYSWEEELQDLIQQLREGNDPQGHIFLNLVAVENAFGSDCYSHWTARQWVASRIAENIDEIWPQA